MLVRENETSPNPTPSVTLTDPPTPISVPAPLTHNHPPTSPYEADINFAMTLDFAAKPRVHRSGEGKVNIHKKVQPCENHQMLVIFTAIKWGCKNLRFALKERNLIKDAACRTIAYDYGYQKPFGRQRIEKWVEQIDKVIKYGPSPSSTPTANPLASKHKGSVAYLDTIENSNPSYARRLL